MWFEALARDLRFSLRSLRRSLGFSAAVIVTLALCIGANTTIMSVLYGLILKPMPFRDPGQLVEVYNSFPKNNQPKQRTSVAQYLDYKANADRFDGFALWAVWTFNIGEDADPERGIGARVTADYFTLLGVQPLLGRFYTMEECVPGKDAVLVLTETFWERKFHGDPGVVGRVIKLGGQPFTIIGVAPRRLEALNTDTTMLKPFEWQPQQSSPQARFLQTAGMYARVKPGVAHSAALAQLDTLEKRYQQIMPAGGRDYLEKTGFQIRLNGVRAEQTKSVRTSLLMLQGGALFVLLLGCVNVANLMLARANARQAELAVRQALGAGRGALARQMLVEGIVLAGGGAVVGLALAWASLRLINIYTTAIVREVDPIRLDGTILSVTLLVTLAVAGFIALLPVVKTWRTNLLTSLQGGTRGASAGGGMRAASGLLVTAQVALALMLLIGAGLLIRSFTRVLAVDPGFDAAHVVQGRTVFGFPGQTLEGVKSEQDLIIARMKEIPGVEKVGYTGGFPLWANFSPGNIPLRNSAAGSADATPMAYVINVSPDYFDAMGIRLLEGRGFNEADAPGQGPPRAFIVDRNFAKKYFPGRSALGEPVMIGGPNTKPEDLPRIVGVVSAARLSGLEDVSGIPFVFIPNGPMPAFSLVLRTSRPASVIVPLMREKLRSVDPSAPLYHEGSLRDDLDYMLSNRRGVMWLLGAFAGIALLLSAVGIYGMLAYDVTQRTREIGIRGAIGASHGQIVAMILKQGLWKAGIGLGLGLAGAFYLSRYLASLLFEVKPTDLPVFAGVTLLLLAVAALASWLPAWRAAKVDPVIALRAGIAGWIGIDSARICDHESGPSMPPPSPRSEELHGHGGGARLLAESWQDLGYALRQLLKAPGFAATVIVTLGLGIGVCTVVFTAVNSTLLHPLAGDSGEGQVIVHETQPPQRPQMQLSPPMFLDLQQQAKSFEYLSAWASVTFTLRTDVEPMQLRGAALTPEVLLGWSAPPALGRSFTAQEFKRDEHVIMLGYSLWQRGFHGSKDVINRAVDLDGVPYNIVGVISSSFARYGSDLEFWIPLTLGDQPPEARGSHYLQVSGKLKQGVTVAQANAELGVIAANIARQFPGTNKGVGLLVRDLGAYINRSLAPMLAILFGAVACVLLIACANVANLLLARATVRQREISIRSALGAGRGRLVRQLLVESMLLALLGGGLGILLAEWGLRFIHVYGPGAGTDMARLASIELDPSVLAFTVGFSLLTGIVFGLAPAWLGSRVDLNEMLKQGSRGSSEGGMRGSLRRVLVVIEVALALVLLTGAGLLRQSFSRLARVDPGFTPDRVATLQILLNGQKYAKQDQRIQFTDELLARIRALPGVTQVGLTNLTPFNTPSPLSFSIAGRPPPGVQPAAIPYLVSSDYFGAMGIRLVRGRTFDRHDELGGQAMFVVNETLARTFFPNEDPLGRTIQLSFGKNPGPAGEIVGVVGDVMQGTPGEPPVPQFYLPWRLLSGGGLNIMARVTGDPAGAIPMLKSQVYALDRDQPVALARPLQGLMDDKLARSHFMLVLLGIYGLIALLIAAVGIYAVMAYSVNQRTMEFGIRMALGASRADVLRQVMSQGMQIVGLGVAVGLAVALALGTVMQSLLYDMSPRDPVTLTIIVGLLLLVSLLACWLPALRATKVDPMVALRAE